MLVLSRKLNQSIVVDNNVEVLIVDIKGDQVKLGIKAPKSVKIFRKEIYDEIREQNKKSMAADAGAVLNVGKLIKKETPKDSEKEDKKDE